MLLGPHTRVLVTGASGGLGRTIARRLAETECDLILTARGSLALERITAEVNATAVAADLSNPQSLRALVAHIGYADVLVANAGLAATGEVVDFSEEEFDRALSVNLRAPIVLSQLLVPSMVERGSGHLVFLASMAAKHVSPKSALYSATKSGLRAFSLGLRQDLRASGVGVSTILPGPIAEAGMWADGGASAPRGLGTRSPADVARAVVQAIEFDRGEIAVAAPGVRLGALVGQISPTVSAALNRRLDLASTAAQVAEAHASKR